MLNQVSKSSTDYRVLNYFNYFTEIEDTFIRRRGKHLLLSPMDWALIESWKEMGVPLHVALRGIERAFDSYEAKPRRRSVKTLIYCQEEVEAQYGEWRDSQLGAAPEETNAAATKLDETENKAGQPFERDVILGHLTRVREQLATLCKERERIKADDFSDTLARSVKRLDELEKDYSNSLRPRAEQLEQSLASLEKMLDQSLVASLARAELAAATAETEAQLRPYRGRMEPIMYQQTLDNLLLKRLREMNHIPRLSLFYL